MVKHDLKQGYNGYSNYETWSIALFFNNDPELYFWKDEVLSQVSDMVVFSDMIKDRTEEFLMIEHLTYYQLQMILSSLGNVNYYELAESFHKDYLEYKEYKKSQRRKK